MRECDKNARHPIERLCEPPSHGRICEIAAADGAPLCVHEFGDVGQPMLVGHPIGYNAAAMAPLSRRLEGLHVFAIDHRGHGGSHLNRDYEFTAACVADDVLGCAQAITRDGQPLLAFGHSMSAAAILLAEALQPGTFDCIFVYEPAMVPPYDAARLSLDNPKIAGMLKRRSRFESLEAVRERYGSVEPFRAFAEDGLAGYIEHGFVNEPGGSVRLACSPEFEVRVSVSGMSALAFTRLPGVQCRVVVFRGTSWNDWGRSGYEVEIAAALPSAQLVYLSALTHFGPQQEPAIVADAILERL
jgi:pimeloyl-ACP methyl ester carboxylesterase